MHIETAPVPFLTPTPHQSWTALWQSCEEMDTHVLLTKVENDTAHREGKAEISTNIPDALVLWCSNPTSGCLHTTHTHVN